MNDNLLEDLYKLGIDAENYRALSLLPLVLIAWADDRVQSAEVTVIERAAEALSLVQGASGQALLHRWLSQPPTEEEQRLGLGVLVELARRQEGAGRSLDASSLQDLLHLCEDVARAAGSLLGLRDPISSSERSAIAQIAQQLSIDTGQSWVELHRTLH